MRIDKYFDFITESKLDLILEAKISYTDDFKEILSKLKSPIADHLIRLSDVDIDISTNNIGLSDKNDSVSFIPENSLKNAKKIVVNPGLSYSGLTVAVFDKGPVMRNLFGIKTMEDIKTPSRGDIVLYERELTSDELRDLSFNNFSRRNILHIKFKSQTDENVYNCLIGSEGIASDLSSVTKSEIKIGRFAKRILDKSGIKVSDKDIEEFVNEYKSRIEIEKDVFRNFEIVKGEDIRKFYNESNYVSGNGTLSNSCMRYPNCSSFFDIYCFNPNKVSLLILKSEEEPGKIRGRALLWNINPIDDGKGNTINLFMDRIYSNKDSDGNLFKKYADELKSSYKRTQNSDNNFYMIFNGNEISHPEISVDLEYDGYYSKYPYMDTLKYLEGDVLSNDGSGDRLEDTNGGDGSCDECGGSGEITCGSCDGAGHYSCSECGSNAYGVHANIPKGKVRCECDNGKVEKDGQMVECEICDGTGLDVCFDCDGSGRVECSDCDGNGSHTCYNCS